MGLFFVSKKSYKQLEENYKRIKENRDYFKRLFDNNKETTEMLIETTDVLNEKVKDLTKQRDEAESRYRKVLASNGGYSTANKRLKKEIRELKTGKKINKQKNKNDINNFKVVEPMKIRTR